MGTLPPTPLLAPRPGRPRARGRAGALALAAWLAATPVPPARAAEAGGTRAGEYELKAAFLLNLARFVEWPPAVLPPGSGELVLGVLGEDPFEGSLERAVKGKAVEGRPVRVRYLKSEREARACHVVFVSASERDHLPRIAAQLRGAPTLTVGDVGPFAEHGGVVHFVREGALVRLVVNPRAAEAGGLKLSARLLSLARLVGEPGKGS